MKKYIANIVIPALMLCGITACSEWTETEPSYSPNHKLAPKSAEYYAKLRNWKLHDDHPRTFGWYGNWTGVGASGEHRLMGLPDSVDFVSMWGNWWGLSEDQMEDKRQAYEIKGLRVKVCFIVANLGDQVTPKYVREQLTDPQTGEKYYEVDGQRYSSEAEAMAAFWGWYQNGSYPNAPQYGDTTPEGIEKAIQKYAKAICDTIVKYDFHGFDYDLERDYGAPGNIASFKDRITIFLKEMSKVCGPKSGTNRLLCVDGQPNILDPACHELLDFFILQSYYSSSYAGVDGGSGFTPRVEEVLENFKDVMSQEEITKRIIVTDDFEQKPEKGGKAETFTTRDGRKLPPIWGLADFYTKYGHQIGGFGIYHIEYDYKNTYATIQENHKGKDMDLSPAMHTGTVCYGYLNGGINLLHNPVNPAKNQSNN